jgi:hypothetical protein
MGSRHPLQSLVPNPGTKGFSLLSGLKRLLLGLFWKSKRLLKSYKNTWFTKKYL